ncbi:MAG: CapA family protein [Bacteroidales bacterium]|nr:CapA family protein [Bacteroidales bacterium]
MRNCLLFIFSFYIFSGYSQDSIDTINSYKLPDTILLKTDTIVLINNIIPQLKDTISIIGVGDIMFGTNFPSDIYLPPEHDCSPLLEELIPILQNADITFGNLEGCFSDTAELEKKCKDTTKCYAFRMPNKFIKCIEEAGFDIISLANNHIGDFGEEGKNNTMNLLDSSGIYYAGLLTHPVSVFIRDSIKYGFCAFSPNKGTCNIVEIIEAQKIANMLDKECDIVIVSFHGGAEGADYQHVTRKTEEFYEENRGNVYEFAHKMIDAGADVVFGHGPHVTRAIDIYKNRFIIYSLGNFCTWRRFNLKGPNGIAPIIKIRVTNTGEFIDGKIFPVYQDGKNGTKIDELKRIIYKLQELNKTDFPELNILITDDGLISVCP